MSVLYKKSGVLHLKNKKGKKRWSEPRVILVSFLAILLPFALLLTTPFFSVSGLSFIDALFTATSAISVTGLGVVDTGSHFSVSGKILLMLLMQIGGLGQMTLSAILLYMFGLRISLRQQSITKEALGQNNSVNLRRLVKHIIVFACVAELIGMIFLSFRFVPVLGWREGVFSALFHAVSAFNNAGFSLFSDSMTSFVGDPTVNFTIAGLFILGGLGFTVISDLHGNRLRGFNHLQLHSKIMLIATPCLLLVGTLLFWFLEKDNMSTLGILSTGEQWLAAFFQSATARTAGFNSISVENLTHPALLVLMVLMMIGAGSTSTGGGIKVSTFVVAMISTWSFLRQNDKVVILKRSVPWSTVTKCLAIIVVSFMVLIGAMFALMISEDAPMSMVMFETISAFATVGLTSGLTAQLSEPGKVIMIVVMIIGRIGPLTLAYMLARPKPTLLKYPEGHVFAG
ncbi:potassium uptake integral membrane protein KtrB [Psychromonas sp. CNPT3]|uniref:TrkH family potassium uptake protein n=1 Tax=Psychromonas sp. CNPT3 TaxID=314282 RepID=UPI00006E76B8|nr:TrkH family potassium uptake protein [Psychromonas sp. CNPT3]AGH80613.1 potassium uptake integral membrane protein KtrB [Psychromonas sp. CNPT3]